METFRREEFSGIIPGYEPAVADWPEVKTAQQQYFGILINESHGIFKQDMTLEDVLETTGQSEHRHWLLFEHDHTCATTSEPPGAVIGVI